MAKVGSSGKGFMIAAGAVALYFLLRGVNFINNIDFVFKKIRLGGSFFLPEAYATFTIINPTDVSVTVDNVTGNIMFKNQMVASVSTDTAVQVMGKQKVDMEVKLIAKITDLITVLSSILKGNLQNNILFSGQVIANGIPIPVKTTIA